MIKLILLIIFSAASAQLGMDTLAKELYKAKKINSEEYAYYSSFQYLLDKITSLFKHE